MEIQHIVILNHQEPGPQWWAGVQAKPDEPLIQMEMRVVLSWHEYKAMIDAASAAVAKYSDLFTPAQLKQAEAIWRSSDTPAKEIAEKVVIPIIDEINRKVGCEQNPLFIACALENTFSQSLKK